MTRPAQRTQRRAVRWPRLLLLAALLLGIVTMHTLGHPTRAHAMEDVPSVGFVPLAGRAPSGVPAHDGVSAHDAAMDSGAIDASGAIDSAATDDGSVGTAAVGTAPVGIAPVVATAAAPGPHTGMDPMSVCLAVLGALTLLILGAGPAGPRRTAPLGGAARAQGRSAGPDPPPRELLDLLTVLRV